MSPTPFLPAALLVLGACAAVPAATVQDRASGLEEIIAQTMKPYAGPSAGGVNTKILAGKVMCGYQGWFCAEGDGADRGWYHWGKGGRFEPGRCTVDLWPDMTEYGPSERYATAFKHADGRAAEVFSSFNRETVLRHYRWMEQYGIDGAFVQRFVGEVSHPKGLRQFTTVLAHCREGANRFGRTYAVMYDLSGLGGGQMQRVMDDWRNLVGRMHITEDPAYLHHRGRPVVALWGFGFSDGRRYTPAEGVELVEWLKNDPQAGRCTVLLGVPTFWRTLERDCVADPTVHTLIAKADVVSPWTVGRYGTAEQAKRHAQTVWTADIAWCRRRNLDYMPVVFPGFSWHNKRPESPLDQIPRRGGEFLWAQYVAAKQAGATMVYQAMFDEVDEGTAIFKCTNDPPVGESRFLTYEGLPSDHYLRLVGQAARMIRGAAPLAEKMPDFGGAAPRQ
jgi:hypothetical protein